MYMITQIDSLVNGLFEKLNIKNESLEIINNESNKSYIIKIKTNESKIIIWNNWDNLDAIQNILHIMISKIKWEKVKLKIIVNGYSRTKGDKLSEFINSKISILKKNRNTIELPYYDSYNRKKIHSIIYKLKDDSIYTKSIWEWKNRRLNIWIKAKKLTIDIDWNDI